MGLLSNIGEGLTNLWNDITGVTASENAAAAQQAGYNQATALLQQYLSPYSQAGTAALSQINALSGASGTEAQQQAIDAIQNSAAFQSQLAQGETSILQNAAATGGLRGGNTQAALAQYSPSLLQSYINDQYANLGSIANIGAGASSSLASGAANLATASGDTEASGILANYQNQYNTVTDFLSGITSIATGGLF